MLSIIVIIGVVGGTFCICGVLLEPFFRQLEKQKMKVGDLVRYKHSDHCTGIILEIGETMIKVRWNDEDITEWMPLYSLESLDV